MTHPSFPGGVGTVTSSQYLIEAGGRKILIRAGEAHIMAQAAADLRSRGLITGVRQQCCGF